MSDGSLRLQTAAHAQQLTVPAGWDILEHSPRSLFLRATLYLKMIWVTGQTDLIVYLDLSLVDSSGKVDTAMICLCHTLARIQKSRYLSIGHDVILQLRLSLERKHECLHWLPTGWYGLSSHSIAGQTTGPSCWSCCWLCLCRLQPPSEWGKGEKPEWGDGEKAEWGEGEKAQVVTLDLIPQASHTSSTNPAMSSPVWRCSKGEHPSTNLTRLQFEI